MYEGEGAHEVGSDAFGDVDACEGSEDACEPGRLEERCKGVEIDSAKGVHHDAWEDYGSEEYECEGDETVAGGLEQQSDAHESLSLSES